jgi:hypothetical protein
MIFLVVVVAFFGAWIHYIGYVCDEVIDFR